MNTNSLVMKKIPIDLNTPSFTKKKIFKKRKKWNIKKLLNLLLLFILIIIIIFQFFIIINQGEKHIISLEKNDTEDNKIFLDQYEIHIYNKIREKIEKYKCSQMWANQREFLNGVIRKFRPKKIVEIGTAQGGGTSIMLNAIKDIENAHLYSIDLSSSNKIGDCVRDYFPEFLNKWTLFQGDVAAKFIEQIGNNIDMLFIDSAHFEPG